MEGRAIDHRREIRFLLNGEEVRLSEVAAEDMVLDFLRLRRRLTGSKEGCAEGDCGTCTMLVGRLAGGDLRYEPVNACIRPLTTLDGCDVVTVEHLAGPGPGLHPVQAAMVAHHASQCGFCTPGVVALAALWLEQPAPSEVEARTALQGNLCRCTGYAPILRAATAAQAFGDPADDPLVAGRAQVAARLAGIHAQTDPPVSGSRNWSAHDEAHGEVRGRRGALTIRFGPETRRGPTRALVLVAPSVRATRATVPARWRPGSSNACCARAALPGRPWRVGVRHRDAVTPPEDPCGDCSASWLERAARHRHSAPWHDTAARRRILPADAAHMLEGRAAAIPGNTIGDPATRQGPGRRTTRALSCHRSRGQRGLCAPR